MKTRMIKIWKQIAETWKMLIKGIKRDIVKMKTGNIVTTLSIVFSLVIVFTMTLSSIAIFAAVEDNIVTVDGHSYTRYLSSNSKYEYVSFGSFPQTKISDGDVSSLGLPTSPVSGKKYLGNDNNWYLYENDLQATPTGYWYRFEPIIWKIIDIDKTKGEEKLVLFTDKIIDSRSYDIFCESGLGWVGWDGYATSNTPPVSHNGLLAYPAVRLYLNSYDSTLDHYSSTTANPNYTTSDYSFSFLKYTEHPDREFYEQGFLEKAFTSSERDLILPDINKTLSTTSTYFDGKAERIVNRNGDNFGKYDKVRLLSYNDAQDSTYGLFQVVNRAANLTDYSKTQLNQTSNNYSWLTMSRNGYTKAKNVLTTNSFGDAQFESNDGIRPVITIDIANAPYLSGDGTLADPYTFGSKPAGEKVDASMFTTYFKSAGVYSPNDHGYVEYGSFPKDEITSENNSSIYDYLDGLKQDGSLLDGKTVQYQGEKYLREDYYHYSSEASAWVTDTHYFKFAPIKWQVLKIDSANNQIELLSESILESRNYDTMYSERTLWNGKTYNSKVNTGSNGKQAYPSIRLYLNNYDSSVSTYNFDKNGPGAGQYSGSSLTYTEYTDRTFYEQGFLGKAFSEQERENIVPSKNDYLYSSFDGAETVDKVRLLSSYELYDSTSMPNNNGMGTSLGFASSDNANGLDTNRIGFETDYSALRATKASVLDSTTGRNSNVWFTKSNSSSGNAGAVHELGYVTSYSHSNFAGVRPVITLSLNGLVNEDSSRTGSINSPYKLGVKAFDTTVTLDDFKTWFDTPGEWSPSSSGYLYFGSFPKTRLSSTEANTLGITSPEDGKVYEIEGEKYLYEISSGGTGYWYKFEPIRWQVLEVDKEKNHLVIMTEDAIEARSWDTINNSSSNVFWDGKNGSSGSGANAGKKVYPMLRLYLNNYDATQNYSAGTGNATYSALTFTTHSDGTKFKDKGFLEKAFTDDEIDSIVPDYNRFFNTTYDGTKTNVVDKDKRPDKVRLLSFYETFDSTSPNNEQIWIKYGFHWDPNEDGLDTNRIGFVTDYCLSAKNFTPNSSYSGYATAGRKSIDWWTLSHSSNGNIQYINNVGNSNGVATTADILGIRPVITLDLSYLKKTSGNGSLDNPFMIETEVFDTTVSKDDFDRYYENPYKGYLYLGRFPKTQISSADATALNLPSSPVEGKIYTSSVDGNDYLAETPVNTSNGSVQNWYKFEPIKWEVLDIKKGSNGEDELVLITESIIESRIYDSMNSSSYNKIYWDGSGTSAEVLNNYSYQNLLRLYLNSYDCYDSNGSEGNYIGVWNLKNYSSLTYKDWLESNPDVTYYNRGFLEKAFNSNERAAIVPDIPRLYSQSLDSDPQNYKDSDGKYDKVRLLTETELNNNYGFVDNASRKGFGTDYGLLNYPSGNTGSATLDPAYVSRKTASWCNLSWNGSSVRMVYADGSLNSNSKIYFFGIRPVITLNIASLSKESGKGSITDPYMLSAGPSELYKEELVSDGEINYFPDGYIDENGTLHNGEGDVEVVSLNNDSELKAYVYGNGMAVFEGTDNKEVEVPSTLEKTAITKVAVSNNGFAPASTSGMLSSMTNLESADLKNLDGTNLDDMSKMFDGCANLEKVEFSQDLDTTKVEDFSEMFKDCSSLTNLNLDSFTIKEGATTTDMFSGCTSLEKINVPLSVDTNSEPDLPVITGSSWSAFKADDTKLTSVTSLPGKNKNASFSYVKTVAPQLIYTDPEDSSKKYYDSDALYTWDISKAGEEGLAFAYYFETGNTNSDGEKEGELVFYSNSDDVTISFDGNFCGYEFGEFVGYNFDRLKTDDSDVDDPLYYKTVLNKSRGFVNINNDTYQPWQLLETYDEEHTITKVIFANEIKLPPQSEAYFALLPNVTEFKGIENLDTSEVLKYIHMFWGLTELEELDLSHFSIEGEVYLYGMFEGCVKLDNLDFSSFNKAEPVDFGHMFANCTSLSSVDLSMIDTSSVESMWGMFKNCINLESLDISNWNTESCYEFDTMFVNCNSLTELDLSHFDFDSSSARFNGMFASTPTLLEFVKIAEDMDIEDLDELSESNYREYSNEFSLLEPKKDSSLNSINLWETEMSGEIRYLFYGLGSLEELDLSHFTLENYSLEYDYEHMLDKCSGLKKIILPSGTPEDGNVTLPTLPEDSTWRGNDNSGPYVYLPKAEDDLEYVYLKSSIIEIGEGTNKKQFKPSDALYAWDISKDGDGSIMAYYFDGNKNKDGNSTSRNYDGELVILSLNENSEMIAFKNCVTYLNNKIVIECFNDLEQYSKNLAEIITTSNYEDYLTETGYKFTMYSEDFVVTPWSILNVASSEHKVKTIQIANDTKLLSGRVLFAKLNSLNAINNLTKLDTSNVASMCKMFENCSSLTSLDLGGDFDTSNVAYMCNMFENCSSLTSLDLGDEFDTQNVTNMSYMFAGCSSLTSLDLGDNFDTSSVTDMSRMFYHCESLTSMNLDFKTTNDLNETSLTTMNGMFAGCSSLTSLDLGENFDTSSVTDMHELFSGCENLANVEVSKFKTNKLQDTGYMFENCSKLQSLNLENWLLPEITTMTYMFSDCYNLESVSFNKNLSTPNLTDTSGMFYYCFKLGNVDLSMFKEAKPDDVGDMFTNCVSMTEIDLSDWDLSTVGCIYDWFTATNDLEEYAEWYGKTIEELSQDRIDNFNSCHPPYESKLEHIYFNEDQTFKPEFYDTGVFLGLHNLKELDLSSFEFTMGDPDITDDDLYLTSNDLYHLYSLNRIILPTKTSDDTVVIELPVVEDSYWTGYKDGVKVGGTYTTLPFNYQGNGDIDEIRLQSSIITVGEGEDAREYNINDAEFAWDISKNEDGSIMAYYFVNKVDDHGVLVNETITDEGGNTNTLGTIIIYNYGDDDNETISFDSYVGFYPGSNGLQRFTLTTTGIYNLPWTFDNTELEGTGYKTLYNVTTPWSILNNGTNYKVKDFVVANKTRIEDMSCYYAGLSSISEIIIDENYNFAKGDELSDGEGLIMDYTFDSIDKLVEVKFERDVPLFNLRGREFFDNLIFDFSDCNIDSDYEKYPNLTASYYKFADVKQKATLYPFATIKVPKAINGYTDIEVFKWIAPCEQEMPGFLMEVHDEEGNIIGYTEKLVDQTARFNGKEPSYLYITYPTLPTYYALWTLTKDQDYNDMGLNQTFLNNSILLYAENNMSMWLANHVFNTVQLEPYQRVNNFLEESSLPLELDDVLYTSMVELYIPNCITKFGPLILADMETAKAQIYNEDFGKYMYTNSLHMNYDALSDESKAWLVKASRLFLASNLEKEKAFIVQWFDYVFEQLENKGYTNGFDFNEVEDFTDDENQFYLMKKYYNDFLINIANPRIVESTSGKSDDLTLNYLDDLSLETQGYDGEDLDGIENITINVYDDENEEVVSSFPIRMESVGDRTFTALNDILVKPLSKDDFARFDDDGDTIIKVTTNKLNLGKDVCSTYVKNDNIKLTISDDVPLKDVAYTKSEIEGYINDGKIKLTYTNNASEEIDLVLNTDYEVTVVSAPGIGVNTFTLNGINNCEGYVPFEIRNTYELDSNKFSVDISGIDLEYRGTPYTVDDIKNDFVLKVNGTPVSTDEYTLEIKSGSDSTNAGTFDIVIKPAAGSSYEGQREETITIRPKKITASNLLTNLTLDDKNVVFYKDGIRNKEEDKLLYAFTDSNHHVTPIFKLDDDTKIYLKYDTVLICEENGTPSFEARLNSNKTGAALNDVPYKNVLLTGLDFDDTKNSSKGINKNNYEFESDTLKSGTYLIKEVTHLFDNVSPSILSVSPDKTVYGKDKDISITMVLSEAIDETNFNAKYVTPKTTYLTFKLGNYESKAYLDYVSLDNIDGEHRTKLTFRGKTPAISENGEFKFTKMTLTCGEDIKDLAGNVLSSSSLTETTWKNNFKDAIVNTNGFAVGIKALDYAQVLIENGKSTSNNTVFFDIDFSDTTLDPSKGYSEDDILSKFKLSVTNNIADRIDNNKELTLDQVDSYSFVTVTKQNDGHYLVKLNFNDFDGLGNEITEKEDSLGYKLKLEIDKDVLESEDSKNVASSSEVNLVRTLPNGTLVIKLERDEDGDGTPEEIPVTFNKSKNTLVDNKGNEVKFQDGDKIIIESSDPDVKISYKEDGTLKDTGNRLEIDIDKDNLNPPVFEEIGYYKDGYAINSDDLIKVTIGFVKLIIIKEGDGGTVTPLGTFDIDADEKEIVVTIDSDYKANIYEGNTLVNTLTETGNYVVKNLKKLLQDLTVKVKFVSTKKPEPTPPGGGGGGGGGGAPAGPTYTIIPDEAPNSTHKAYMKGYEDNTFRPNEKVSREEVAAIVARLDSEFNEDYNFTSFNTFTDANDKWSKNYIGFCKMKDLIHGYEDGSFHPNSVMTRAELATLVNNFLRVQNANFDDVDLSKPAFSDVDGRWYEESVNKLAHLGILNGYEDGTFRGDNPVTRIEVAIVMNKINHRNVTKDIPDEYKNKVTSMFKDVTKGRWFFNDVAEAAVDHPIDLY